MTKSEFIKLLSEKECFKTKVEAEKALKAVLATIEESLQKCEDVNFVGWGKFVVVERPKRTGRNPKTGKAIKIPAKKAVRFKAGKTLAEKVNK